MTKQAYSIVLSYFTCFSTGFAILVLELVAFRLLAPYYGVSNIVTGIIINAILLALAAGYLLGGYVADKYKSIRLPYFVILMSTVYLIVVYFTYTVLLHALADESVTTGSILSVVIMFFIPTLFLAFIPPYIVQALSIQTTVGQTTGLIYALSTLGSIVGGILTTFIFIPILGSHLTFMLAIILLIITSTLGLIVSNIAAVLILSLILPFLLHHASNTGQYVYKGESEYNEIAIKKGERGDYLYLLLNDMKGHHSKTLDPDTMLSNDYYDYFLVAQLLSNAQHTLILGNAAGTAMRQASYFFHSEVDGVEIDPKLTMLGQRYFGLKLNGRTNIYHEDARTYMNQNQQRYDTVIVDVYAGGPYVPFHVTTLEFYETIKKALSNYGVVAVNLPFYSMRTKLSEVFLNTIATVFPNSVYTSGCVAFAFATPMSKKVLADRLASKNLPEVLKTLSYKVISHLKVVTVSKGGKIFTDDLAPVENMTQAVLEKGLPSFAGCHHL